MHRLIDMDTREVLATGTAYEMARLAATANQGLSSPRFACLPPV